MNELALFAGAGGGILGGVLLGWRTVCAVEIDAYASGVLLARQNDGTLPPFPIWDDVRTFDGRPWRGRVDVVSGGFPCQDISVAGKGAGITGERSGLWREFARIIGEVRPSFAFIENSPALATRGLATVLGGLAKIGYDAEWMVLGADDCGAPHRRKRIWILAHADSEIQRPQGGKQEGRRAGDCGTDLADAPQQSRQVEGRQAPQPRCGSPDVPDADSQRRPQRQGEPSHDGAQRTAAERSRRWPAEPPLDRVVNGFSGRVAQIRGLGNAQVPRVAATAWRLLASRLKLEGDQ